MPRLRLFFAAWVLLSVAAEDLPSPPGLLAPAAVCRLALLHRLGREPHALHELVQPFAVAEVADVEVLVVLDVERGQRLGVDDAALLEVRHGVPEADALEPLEHDRRGVLARRHVNVMLDTKKPGGFVVPLCSDDLHPSIHRIHL